MPLHQYFSELNDALYQLEIQLEEYILILQTERTILDNFEIEKLSDIIDCKNIILQKLASLNQLIQHLINRSPSKSNLNGIAHIISQFLPAQQDNIKLIWNKVQKLLYQTDRMNLINGVIITILKNHNNSLLNILTKKTPLDLYGPSTTMTSHHTIDIQA